jgi:hypothetical protein
MPACDRIPSAATTTTNGASAQRRSFTVARAAINPAASASSTIPARPSHAPAKRPASITRWAMSPATPNKESSKPAGTQDRSGGNAGCSRGRSR